MLPDLSALLPEWLVAVLSYVGFLAAQLLALAIIPARRRSGAAQTWLLLIFLQPILGWALYLLIADRNLSRSRRLRQETMEALIAEQLDAWMAAEALRPVVAPDPPDHYKPLIRLGWRVGGFPAFGGNHVEFLPDYDEAIGRLAADIDAATQNVHIEYFALAMDATTEVVFQALERAAARGVKVRVLFDHLGSVVYRGYRAMRRRLRAANIEAYRVLPVDLFDAEFSRFDLRNHRKIAVLDGAVAYIGSQNLIDKTYHRSDGLAYEDLVARVTGPVATQLDAVFAADWYAETKDVLPFATPLHRGTVAPTGSVLAQVLPSGSAHDLESNLRLFVSLLHQAQRQIVIVTPYFVPDVTLLDAMTTAAQRGVSVTLIVSGMPDQFLVSRAQWSYYEELLEAGVKVRVYNPPVLLHTKTISIDNDIAVIGSSNLDMRSFRLSLEVTLMLYDPGAVARLRTVEAAYLARSSRIVLEEWRRRSSVQKFAENLARLFSPLL